MIPTPARHHHTIRLQTLHHHQPKGVPPAKAVRPGQVNLTSDIAPYTPDAPATLGKHDNLES